MSSRKTIALAEPFEFHGQTVKSVVLVEPTGWQAATIGEPRVLVHNAATGGYFVEMPDIIARYLERCIEHDLGAEVVRLLSLTDVLQIKSALFDFFIEAEAKRDRKSVV